MYDQFIVDRLYEELRVLRDNFEAECWKIKTAHDRNFRAAFSGVRSSRARFCDKILEEAGANQAAVHPIDDLKTRADTVFAEGVDKFPALSSVNGAEVMALESCPVLAKKVVGKEDIDVAGLIRRLGNSDFTRALITLRGIGSPCPFCQKALGAELLEKLDAFFDEAYLADIGEIARIEETYGTLSDTLLNGVDAALTSGNPHIDVKILRPMVGQLRSLVTLNQHHIGRKRENPAYQSRWNRSTKQSGKSPH